MEGAARALYQCAGHGRTHMRGAALAQICVAGPRATKRNHVSHAPSTAQGRAVIARARVCKIALARGPRALAERLPRNADSRAAKRIALVWRAVIILAAALGTKSIAQPLPRGATHSPISSCTAPPSTSAPTCRGKLCGQCNASCWRRAYECIQRCAVVASAGETCVFKAGGEHVCSERKANAAPPRGQSFARGPRTARADCGARATASERIGHACFCSANIARSSRRASDRAREPMTVTYLSLARCKCRARNLRAVAAHAQRYKRERRQRRTDLTRRHAHTKQETLPMPASVTRARARIVVRKCGGHPHIVTTRARLGPASRLPPVATCGGCDDASELMAVTPALVEPSRAQPAPSQRTRARAHAAHQHARRAEKAARATCALPAHSRNVVSARLGNDFPSLRIARHPKKLEHLSVPVSVT